MCVCVNLEKPYTFDLKQKQKKKLQIGQLCIRDKRDSTIAHSGHSETFNLMVKYKICNLLLNM